MLAAFRKFARSWVAAILIGLLVISFGIWGINDIFTGSTPDAVARVAGKPITQAEYKAEFERLLKRAKEETKRDVTTEEARKEGLDNAVLERLVGERAFAALTDSLGLRVADKIVQAEISKIPGFQEPGTGRFSQQYYELALRDNGFTPVQFERVVRSDLARQSLTTAASSGFRAPRVFASQTLAFGTERRMVTIIPVAAALAGAPRQPTPAQIKSLYDESRQALMRPETRSVTLAIASLAEFEAKAVSDEAEARRVFETNKARLSRPAKRSLVQIVAPDRAKAEQAAARLRAGEDPKVIASSLRLGLPVVLANVTAGGIPDENVSKAAFEAQSGAVLVVPAKLQPFAAIKITEAITATEARFEDSAADIRRQLKSAAAGEALTDASEAFDAVINDGGTLEAAAAKAGFRIVKVGDIVADGRSTATGQAVPELAEAPATLREIFAGAKGDVSDLAVVPGDRYMAYRIDTVTVAAPPPMASITNELTQEWIRRDIFGRLQTKANEILAEAKRTSLESAAAKYKLPTLRQPVPLTRGQGGQALGSAVFGAKKGEIVAAQTANGVEFAVIRIDDILRDDDARVPDRMAQAETAVRQSVQRDLIAALERVARDRARAQLYPSMVGRALGDAPVEDGAAPAAAASKAPAVPAKTP